MLGIQFARGIFFFFSFYSELFLITEQRQASRKEVNLFHHLKAI
jgi:hypothetical protein